MLLALLLGGVHTLQLTSTPPGATVYHGTERLGVTPMTVDIRPRVGAPPSWIVRLPAYRTAVVSYPRRLQGAQFTYELLTFQWRKAFGATPTATLELYLIPEHGGIGTWEQAAP